MSSGTSSVDRFAALIPERLLHESGKAFYSGRVAFSTSEKLYVLGVNPGGDPVNYRDETVGEHTRRVLNELPEDWSAYRDEVWEGAAPGTYGMAPRVLHLFKRLGMEPGAVPASNLIFVRSRREEQIKERQEELSDLCWPFHAAVLERLRPRVIVCMGATAGRYVRKRLGAGGAIAQFTEQNERRWKSQVFKAAQGSHIVVATHPSIADWCSPLTDPSDLVLDALR